MEKLVDEVPICMRTEEVAGRPTMVVNERALLVSELKEVLVGETTEEDVMQEVVDKDETGTSKLMYHLP